MCNICISMRSVFGPALLINVVGLATLNAPKLITRIFDTNIHSTLYVCSNLKCFKFETIYQSLKFTNLSERLVNLIFITIFRFWPSSWTTLRRRASLLVHSNSDISILGNIPPYNVRRCLYVCPKKFFPRKVKVILFWTIFQRWETCWDASS